MWLCGLVVSGEERVGGGMIGWGGEGSVVIGGIVEVFVEGIGSFWSISWNGVGKGLCNVELGIVVVGL